MPRHEYVLFEKVQSVISNLVQFNSTALEDVVWANVVLMKTAFFWIGILLSTVFVDIRYP
jgi:hypothetical protein